MRPPGKHRAHSPFRRHPSLDYRPPPYLRNLKLGLIAFCTIAGAAIAYVVFWFVIAVQFRAAAVEWAEARQADGYAVAYANMVLSGFPWRVRLDMDAPAFAAPASPAAWEWKGSRAALEARPWLPWRVRVDISGAQLFALTHAGGPVRYSGQADRLTADLVLSFAGAEEAELNVAGLEAAAGEGSGRFAVSRASIFLKAYPDADADYRTRTFEVGFDGAGLQAPKGLSLPLGERFETLKFSADLMGRIAGGRLSESLAVWRDQGGTLEVVGLHVGYGPLVLDAGGTLALDETMQPAGAFTAKAQGFFETIDALRRNGLVRARDAITAKVVLGALAKRPRNGGPATLNLALTMQQGKLYAGPVPIADIPEIDWGSPAPGETPGSKASPGQ